jgi:hypothetical protein
MEDNDHSEVLSSACNTADCTDDESLASTVCSDHENVDDLSQDSRPVDAGSSEPLNDTFDYGGTGDDSAMIPTDTETAAVADSEQQSSTASVGKKKRNKLIHTKVSGKRKALSKLSSKQQKQVAKNYQDAFQHIGAMLTSTPTKDAAATVQKMQEEGDAAAEVVPPLSKINRKIALGTEENVEWKVLKPMARLLAKVGLNLVRQNVCIELARSLRNSAVLSNTESESAIQKLKDEGMRLALHNERLSLSPVLDCKSCAFWSTSINVLEHHYEFAHEPTVGVLQCAMCGFECALENEFVFHMEAEHARQGRIRPKSLFYVCPTCPHENRTDKVFKTHLEKCLKSYKPKSNLGPSVADSDIPIKKAKKAASVAPSLMLTSNEMPEVAPLPLFTNHQAMNSVNNILLQSQANRSLNAVSAHSGLANIPTVFPGGQMPYMSAQPRASYTSGPTAQFTASTGSSLPQFSVRVPSGPAIHPLVLSAEANALRQNGLPANIEFQSIVNAVPRTLNTADYLMQVEVCELCDAFVRGRSSLRVHLNRAHKIDVHHSVLTCKLPPVTCDRCTQRFWTTQGLRRHVKLSHDGDNINKIRAPTYTCSICGVKHVNHVLEHLRDEHGISVSQVLAMKQCPCCGELDNSLASLYEHMLASHVELALDHAFDEYRELLQGFIASIDVEANLPAAPIGGPFSALSHQLGKSLPPECTVCAETFADEMEYEQHCHDEHWFACLYCDCKFADSGSAREHVGSVHASETRPCPICDDAVPIGAFYTRHMAERHLQSCSVSVKSIEHSADKSDGETEMCY